MRQDFRNLKVCVVAAGCLALASLAVAAGMTWNLPGDSSKTISFQVGGRSTDYHTVNIPRNGNLTISVANDGYSGLRMVNTITLRIPSQSYYRTIAPGENMYVGNVVKANSTLQFQVQNGVTNSNNLLATNYRVMLGYAPN